LGIYFWEVIHILINMDIKQIRDIKGLTQQDVADITGIPRYRIAKWEQGKGKPKAEDAIILKKHFGELYPVMGEQYNKSTQDIVVSKSIKGNKNKHPVRFYDVDFLAGTSLIEFYDDSNMIEVAYEMDIPEFAGCTAFRAYSDSMEPLIKSGSILFGTKIDDWVSHLEYGQIYGIVCNDGRRYLKYIRRHSDVKTTFLLRSENSEMYDEFELPKTAIKNLWLINGWLNRRT